MSTVELAQAKTWYLSAVESCLVIHGMTRDQAARLIEGFNLKEKLDAMPEALLRGSIESVAKEIMAAA